MRNGPGRPLDGFPVSPCKLRTLRETAGVTVKCQDDHPDPFIPSATLDFLLALPDIECQFVGNPVFVDIADVLHGFAANAFCGDHLHIVKPDVGVKAYFFSFLTQSYDFTRACVISGE